VGKRMIWGALLLLLASCATTEDPRQGGLFGYNREAYEKRLAERRAALQGIQVEQRDETERSRQLETELALKQTEYDTQKGRLDALDNDLINIHKDLEKYQARTRAQSAEKKRLDREVKRLNNQIESLRNQNRLSIDEKEKKIASLKAEIDELLKLTLLLTQ
jgi:chromosome segregation ATPase